MQTRYRNYALWVSLISQLALVIQGVSFAIGIDITAGLIDSWVIVANSILILLATLGIISNPTKPNDKGYNL